MASVRKLTNNVGGTDEDAAVTATTDKLFLLSYSEIVPTSYWADSDSWTSSEGTQYEAFKGKVTQNNGKNSAIASSYYWWERSAAPDDSEYFFDVDSEGDPSYGYNATDSYCVCPDWCFWFHIRLTQGPRDSVRAFLLAVARQFEVHGTGSRFEEK